MRALTQFPDQDLYNLGIPCNNEVLAREGIDTILSMTQKDTAAIPGNNEVLAREGIDTMVQYHDWIVITHVTMRY